MLDSPHHLVCGLTKLSLEKRISWLFTLAHTPVTTVTVATFFLGDTSFVNMVRRARKKALFEPGDTRQQWKGEAAASLV